MSTDFAMPVALDSRSPLEWTDADESRPFLIPEWQSLGAASLSPRTMSRHFLVVGETGSGKTRSGIMPILGAALQYGESYPELAPAMLVIDPKFEITSHLRQKLAREPSRLVVLDPLNPSHRINLFEGKRGLDSSAIVDYALKNCSPAYVASSKCTDSFWRDSAKALLEAFVAADMERQNRREPLWLALFRIADVELRERWTSYGIEPQSDSTNYFANTLRYLSMVMNSGKFEQLRPLSAHFAKLGVPRPATLFLESLVTSPESQRASQLSQTLLFLKDLTNEALNAVIDLRPRLAQRNSGDNIRVGSAIDSGLVLAFSPDSASASSDTIGRVLKTKFFEASFSRSNKLRPVFYICDEFHRFVTADPESGEHSFLDRCRAFRVVCALATQSLASLRNGLELSSTNSSGHLDSSLGIIIGNTGNKLTFRNTDPDTQYRLAQLIPRSPGRGDLHVLEVHPLASLAPGTCYYAFADGRMGRAHVSVTPGKPQPVTQKRVSPIRLARPLSVEEVMAVCDEVDRRITYYWENRFQLEIDSPGGQIPALQYFLDRMNHWRAQGASIATLGLTSVASAAGVVLSMGDVGSRRALRGCRLLYHDSRVIVPTHQLITRTHALAMAEQLDDFDSLYAKLLAEHLFGAAGLPDDDRFIDFGDPLLEELQLGFTGAVAFTEELFLRVYQTLNRRDSFITAAQAKLLKLIDHID